MFTWPFVSTLPGEAMMEGNVQGVVNVDQVRRSIVTRTSVHRIYTPVPALALYPTANLPFSVNRGQQDLVPLTLTFINAGDADVADAELTSIRLRFLETVDGPGVVPADLLDRIVVSEGTDVYLATTNLPTSGSEVDLVFTHPVVIPGSAPVTLGLRLDLRLDSTVPSFLISIAEAGWLVGNDAVNGADLTIVPGEGTFPVRTGQATLVSPASGLNVASGSLPPETTVPGQTGIVLAEISLSQPPSNDNSSTVDLGRLAFDFHDTNGSRLSNPGQWFSRLSLRSAFQEHYSGFPVVEPDSLVVLQLSTPVTISGSATLVLQLVGDIATDSPLGRITPLVGPVAYFDARDGNMNDPVPVTLTTEPAGAVLDIIGAATVLNVSGAGVMPAQVSQGTRDLTALNLTLTNAGETGTAEVIVDTLVLEFLDAARQPLAPDLYLDRLQIMQGTDVLGFLIDPAAADGVVTLPISDRRLAPGQNADLRVSLDIRPDSPTGTLEVVVGAAGIHVVDAITGQQLPAQAAPGTSLPVSSGVATVVVPADELLIAFTGLMPPLLAPTAELRPVFSLAFNNPTGAGGGGIELNALTLVQDVTKASQPDLGQLLAAVQIRLGDTIVASTTDLAPAATSVTLVPGSPFILAAGQLAELVVEIVLRHDAPPGSLQLILQEDGVGAGPAGGVGVAVRVLPVSGQTFPFVTEPGNIGSASLSESYLNFPNPFAAGRETTTFAFSLSGDARVDLRIMTPHGELVATILQNEVRPAGLYQSDVWPGLNGNGVPVHNGVYLAELVVQYSDGSRERILRKVAVVR